MAATLVLLLLVLVGLGSADTSPAARPATGLVYSSAPTDEAMRRLTGATIFGSVYVMVNDPRPIKRVRFFLDDPSLGGKPLRTDGRAPFDLRPLSTRLLADGRHTLVAAAELRDGRQVVYRADFSTPHLFMSPSGQASRCTQAAPCNSFARAYALAAPGQTVELATGTYNDETITAAPKPEGAQQIVFRPAEGAAPTISGLLRWEGTSAVSLEGLSIGEWYLRGVSDMTLRNVNAKMFFIRSSARVRVLGGSVGGIQTGDSATIGSIGQGAPLSEDIVLDGVTFHDIGRGECAGCHVECLFIQDSARVVVRNSKFTRCDVMDVFLEDLAGTPPISVTLENNWFDAPTSGGYYAVNFRWDEGDVLRGHSVRYNSFRGGLLLNPGAYEDVRVVGNVGHLTTCVQGVVFSHNVWDDKRCSSADRIAPSGFVNPSGFDLRLNPNAAAIDRGDPKDYPPRDIFGHKRPRGKAPDAGAAEVR